MTNRGQFKPVIRNGLTSAKILPQNWEEVYDPETQRYFYVDHNSKRTTWLHPADTYNKPRHPSECHGDELPCGWERINDPILGTYYADHIEHKNHWTDPVSAWQHRENKLNQHHHSNSHQITQQHEYNNNFDHHYTNHPIPSMTNNITISQSKPELSYCEENSTQRIEKSMLDLNISNNDNSETAEPTSISSSQQMMNTNISRSSRQFDASLLDLMENRFGKNDESLQV